MIWSEDLLIKVLQCRIKGRLGNITGYSIDTRTLQKGDIFFAFSGATVDGHKFLSIAEQKGASAAIVTYIPDECADISLPLIVVKSVHDSMIKMAKYVRQNSNATFIAVTGSVGKTTTKEILKLALSNVEKCFANEGNLNNDIGLPLSLLRSQGIAQYIILEMGMNSPGEIAILSSIMQPNIVIITDISPAHIQNFKDIYGIADEKISVCKYLTGAKKIILNYNSKLYQYMETKILQNAWGEIVKIGENAQKEVDLSFSYLGVSFEHGLRGAFYYMGKEFKCDFQYLYGRHFLYGMSFALLLSKILGHDIEKMLSFLKKFTPISGRGSINSITIGEKNITVIDESYNANPKSMLVAIDQLKTFPRGGRKIAILGDMLELGEYSKELHISLSDSLRSLNKVIFMGSEMHFLYNALKDYHKESYFCNSCAEIVALIVKDLIDGDVLLLKASNALQMSEVLVMLKNCST